MTVAHTWSSWSQERNKDMSLWGWGVTIEVMVVSGKVMQGEWRLSKAKHGATFLEFQHLKRWSRKISWFPGQSILGNNISSRPECAIVTPCFKIKTHHRHQQQFIKWLSCSYEVFVKGWIWIVCHKDKCLVYRSPVDCTVLGGYGAFRRQCLGGRNVWRSVWLKTGLWIIASLVPATWYLSRCVSSDMPSLPRETVTSGTMRGKKNKKQINLLSPQLFCQVFFSVEWGWKLIYSWSSLSSDTASWLNLRLHTSQQQESQRKRGKWRHY